MRKTAEERRRDALGAARRIVAAEGLAATSVRRVAEEAGMSAGSLRHIFPTQDDLYVALLDHGAQDLRRRIEQINAAYTDGPVERACDVLLEVLPLTPEGRADALSQLAVFVGDPGNPEITRARRSAGDGLDHLCAALVGDANALELRLLIDGLMLRILERDNVTRTQVRSLLRAHLLRLGVQESA